MKKAITTILTLSFILTMLTALTCGAMAAPQEDPAEGQRQFVCMVLRVVDYRGSLATPLAGKGDLAIVGLNSQKTPGSTLASPSRTDPDPVQEPNPVQKPDPQSKSATEPDPVQEPDPQSKPATEPDPVQEPDPQSKPVTEPDPVPASEPVPMAPEPPKAPAPAEPAPITVTENKAPGTLVKTSKDGASIIDYSNTADGYVMIKTAQEADTELVVQIKAPSGVTFKFFHTSPDDVYQAFPISEGSGTYKVSLHRKNPATGKYATLVSQELTVTAKDDVQAFIRPNYYVDYTADTKCVQDGSSVCAGAETELDKVAKVFNYVIDYFTYDYDKAANPPSGYYPVLDTVYEVKKGICFDYAAVMAAMLRTQGVPTKLVVGYAGNSYHAWISVYTSDSGWIESVIFFDGSVWKFMDPTWASTSERSEKIMNLVNEPGYYTEKFVY